MVVYQEKDVFRHALCIASVCGAGCENPGKALCPPEPSFFMRRERSLSAKGVGVAEFASRGAVREDWECSPLSFKLLLKNKPRQEKFRPGRLRQNGMRDYFSASA